MIRVFHEQPVFHRRRFFHGKAIQGAEAPEIAWLDPSGKRNVGRQPGTRRSSAAWACNSSAANIDVDEHGEPIVGDTMLLLFNADHANSIPFMLPPPENGEPWELLFDTARPNEPCPKPCEGQYPLEAVSVVLFRSKRPIEEEDLLKGRG